jgi:hypothetical protein
MMREHLAAELSLLVGRLQRIATTASLVGDAAQLRQTAEDGPEQHLAAVANEALILADAVCWQSLSSGDLAAFATSAAVGRDLFEFGVCALLIDERMYT